MPVGDSTRGGPTREEALAALRTAASELGGAPTASWWQSEYGQPHRDQIVRLFGGWADAVAAAADTTAKKQPRGRHFNPGQSGNPKGRPKGARNRMGTQFIEAL